MDVLNQALLQLLMQPKFPAAQDQYWQQNFNTPLTTEQQAQFDTWAAAQKKAGRDVTKDMQDYDVPGYFISTQGNAAAGHWPDTYKKPNHITFSNQSQYHGDLFSGGQWIQNGKTWTYTPSPFTQQLHGKDALVNYFAAHEPDSILKIGD